MNTAKELKAEQDEMVTAVIADFFAWLEGHQLMFAKLISGGRYAAIYRMGFNHRIVTGRLFERGVFEDGWCYPTLSRAKAAFDAWNGEGEPDGWFKHPRTNRCRPGCDPARESIGWPLHADPYEGAI